MTSRTSNTRRIASAADISAVVAIAVASLQLGCATTLALDATDPAHESQGSVTIGKDDENGDTRLSIVVRHLAMPSEVAADAKVYVVWIEAPEAPVQNAGVLVVSDELVGRLETTTPHRCFLVLVTPEPNAQAVRPTHDSVMSVHVDRSK